MNNIEESVKHYLPVIIFEAVIQSEFSFSIFCTLLNNAHITTQKRDEQRLLVCQLTSLSQLLITFPIDINCYSIISVNLTAISANPAVYLSILPVTLYRHSQHY